MNWPRHPADHTLPRGGRRARCRTASLTRRTVSRPWSVRVSRRRSRRNLERPQSPRGPSSLPLLQPWQSRSPTQSARPSRPQSGAAKYRATLTRSFPMIEAYEIGISLALQDGVSDGIDLIRRKLASLDQAIAATSNSLARLQQAGGVAQPRSPAPQRAQQPAPAPALMDPAAELRKVSNLQVPREPDSGRLPPIKPSFDGGNVPLSLREVPPPVETGTTLQPPVAPRPTAPERPVLAQSLEAPLSKAILPFPPAPASPSKPAVIITAQAPPSTLPSPIQAPAGPSKKQPAITSAPEPQGGPPPPAIRTEASHPNVPAEMTTVTHHHHTHPSRHELATRDISQTVSLPIAEARKPASPTPPARSAPPLPSDHPPTTQRPFSIPAGPQKVLPTQEPAGASNAPPASPPWPRVPAPPSPQPASFAPPPPSLPAITLQGDIILDGARVGRWMTSSLARQAARPPAGPTGPDPRQTPLWSGQAQGF